MELESPVLRFWIAVCVLAVAASACGPAERRPIVAAQRAEPSGQPAVEFTLTVEREHLRDLSRYVGAARASIETLCVRFGAFPRDSISIVDPPFAGSMPMAAADITLARTPWLSVPRAMVPELAVMRGVSRWYWREIAGPAMPAWFVDGLAEHIARQMTVPLFERFSLPGGYALLEQRVFGGLVPRAINLRMQVDTDGEPLAAYRRDQTVEPSPQPGSSADARSLAAKTALALATLERWLGRPVFDQVLSEFTRRMRLRTPTIADFVDVASDTSGQDLSWLFEQAFGSSSTFDYAVESLASGPAKDGVFQTTVVASRPGPALFTGSSGQPAGPFERGRGISVRVSFADGETRTDYWDGRRSSKTFVYQSRARADSAEVDPDRVLLLDMHPVNNSRTLTPRAGIAATKWAARWLLWLEDWLLTCAALA
jgi:hypothetical protein